MEIIDSRRVLFLCTGNSARSIMAEAILRRDGAGRYVAFSAGSHPTGRVNPLAIETLQKHGVPIAHLRSKSWGEFETEETPPLDFVFTVCDHAAAEPCPVWPGRPVTAHWGVPDPASVEGSPHDRRVAFARAFTTLATRIDLFLRLPIADLDDAGIRARLVEIGHA